MKHNYRNLTAVVLSLVSLSLAYLFALSNPSPQPEIARLVIFTALLAYTTTYGIPIGVGEVSLFPMVAMSAMIVMGPATTAIAVIISDSFYGLFRWLRPGDGRWERSEDGFSLFATTAANITMHILSVLAAGIVYLNLE